VRENLVIEDREESSVRHKEDVVRGVHWDNPKIREMNPAMSVNSDEVDSRLSEKIGKERAKPGGIRVKEINQEIQNK
jgi:hypothetical protein